MNHHNHDKSRTAECEMRGRRKAGRESSTMMTSAILTTAATTALEESAFVLAAPVLQQPTYAFGGELIAASLAYDGPARGVLLIVAPPELAPAFASSALDGDESGGLGKWMTAFARIANAIGGLALESAYGQECDIEVGKTAVRRVTPLELHQCVSAATCHISLMTNEGYLVEVAAFELQA